jgi:hypothetical protein
MMDSDGYPTDRELALLKRFKFQCWQDILDLLERICELWRYENGFVLTGKNVLKLQLHTFGWSGNESVIAALECNPMFWALFWQKSERGGHYWFEFRMSMFRKR